MSAFKSEDYRNGWIDAIRSTNEQYGPGMAAAIREAKVQVLRDAANEIPAVYHRGDSPSAWLTRRADQIDGNVPTEEEEL